MGPYGFLENLILLHLEAFHVLVAAPDAAVVAILDAQVTALNDAAEIGNPPHILFLDKVGAVIQRLKLGLVRDRQQRYQFFGG